jgi:hypothetical protein
VTDPAPAGGNDAELMAARERTAALLDWATHVQLDVVVVSAPDRTRLAARADAVAVAARHGRRPLLVEAVTAARDLVRRAFAAGGYSGTWAVTDWSISVANGADRVAASAALEEAAVAMVVLDVADPETTDVLQSTWANLVELRGIERPGDLARLTEAAKRRWTRD